MKFRSGILIGFGAGYVLGAKAGKERYEQIERFFSSLTGTAPVQSAIGKGKEAIEAAGDAARIAASNGFHEASKRVRDAVEGA